MFAEKAISYYNDGCNCSECMLKAYSDIYGTKIDDQLSSASKVINNGFGVGSMCSLLITGVIILSIHFGTDEARGKRLIMLEKFYDKFGNFNCAIVKKKGCENVIREACGLLEELLE